MRTDFKKSAKATGWFHLTLYIYLETRRRRSQKTDSLLNCRIITMGASLVRYRGHSLSFQESLRNNLDWSFFFLHFLPGTFPAILYSIFHTASGSEFQLVRADGRRDRVIAQSFYDKWQQSFFFSFRGGNKIPQQLASKEEPERLMTSQSLTK